MLGPDGWSKCSQASCLYGPWRATKTPLVSLAAAVTAALLQQTHTHTRGRHGHNNVDTDLRINTKHTVSTCSEAEASREQQGRLTMGLRGILSSILILNIACVERLCQQGCMLINLTNTGVMQPQDYKVLRLLVPSSITINPYLLLSHFLSPSSLQCKERARRQVSQLPLLFAFQFLNYPEQADRVKRWMEMEI